MIMSSGSSVLLKQPRSYLYDTPLIAVEAETVRELAEPPPATPAL